MDIILTFVVAITGLSVGTFLFIIYKEIRRGGY